jgi:glucosylceramidase
MTATASTPQDATNAVDDDATTRWTTAAAQTPGQWLQVDLGSAQPIRRVVLDTGVDRGDYPRGYTLETSTDGSTWTPAASGAGSGQLTTIDLPATSARYIRVTQTGSSGSWWSVADLRVYG